ncbi:hypothetical protein [Litorihabitans aurantiacus]|uniref:Uncharacterized protein n=1 Tax=Litorihabitans aurantiacus TaxID=1930061 RepID=A0AA37XE02_9MICO|nr:hypothetical protein [Litorihabitans aurantiacus]GMA31429.1 hypothetical protein GCM10025875_14210 [Litorihabitans aurantiacus]
MNLLIVVGLATFSTLPLLDPVPDLTLSLARGPVTRVAVLAIVAVCFVVVWVSIAVPGPSLRAESLIAAALLASVAPSVIVMRSAGWVGPFALGITLVFVDGAPDSPVARAAEMCDTRLVVGACVAILVASGVLLRRVDQSRDDTAA